MEVPKRAIGVFTSGGDAPGMNAALRAIVGVANARGLPVYAIYEGYQGMVDGAPFIRPLTWEQVKPIIRRGGTIIGSARCAEFRHKEGRTKAVLNLLKHGIDSLVVIGGDGSLTGANILLSEWSEHLNILLAKGLITQQIAKAYSALAISGLVGSIDNDMCGTDLTMGANTALERIIFAIDCIASTAASHQRVFILEVMGRNCGYLALMAGIISGADWVFVPEEPPKEGWETALCEKLKGVRAEGRRMSLIIVSEGAITRDGKHLASESIRSMVEKNTGYETRVTVLGHMQRGGDATVVDRLISTLMGAQAVEVLVSPIARASPQMIGMRGADVISSPLMECVRDTQKVPKAIADKDFVTACKLRGATFEEAIRINKLMSHRVPRAPPKTVHRIAIMNVGASSPGMNCAVRVAVRTAIAQGHVPLLVRDGWPGLRDRQVEEANWMSVSGWGQSGGAYLSPSRSLPKSDTDWATIGKTLLELNIDRLVMIGGFEGYLGLAKLEQLRCQTPALCNLVLLAVPATISNNVPGTDESIGADRALANLTEAADKILESGGGAKRTYVMEVMGNYCGYLAFMGALAAGADQVYVHEIPLSMNALLEDYHTLEGRFGGKNNIPALFVSNENASDLLNTDFIVKLLSRDKNYLTRKSVLGHLQQGGAPTAQDRILATRMGYNSINYLVSPQAKSSMCGIRQGNIVFSPLDSFWSTADQELRRPLDQRWLKLLPLFQALAKPPKPEAQAPTKSKL